MTITTFEEFQEYIKPGAGPSLQRMPEKLREVTDDDLRDVIARGWWDSKDGKAWRQSRAYVDRIVGEADDEERKAIQAETEPDYKSRAAGDYPMAGGEEFDR